MKSRLQIRDILNTSSLIDTSVVVKGWVRSKRDSKAGFSFLDIHDGSCFNGIQVIVNNDIANYESEVLHLSTGCSVSISGRLIESEGKGQSVEVQADAVTVLGMVDNPEQYPVAKKRHSLEYLRTVSHLRPRTNVFGAITRIRNKAALAIHQYFNSHNFYWVNTPIITASDCEGAGELFKVSTLDFMNIPKDSAL